jgi:hypothetical protein
VYVCAEYFNAVLKNNVKRERKEIRKKERKHMQ